MPDNQTVLHSQVFDQKNHFHFLAAGGHFQ